jgi:phenylacetate-CoA ligase
MISVPVVRRTSRDWAATAIGFGRMVWLAPLDVLFLGVGLRFGWLKALFAHTPATVMTGLGQLRAERAAWRAIRRVPAYRAFLAQAHVGGRSLFPFGILRHLPETDKHSYVDRFDLAERCVDGSFPFAGTTIDESSGSTGTPYNWVRGRRELDVAHRNVAFFARYTFGTRQMLAINAFSMGAWATGLNMTIGLLRHTLVKSTGPDIAKILATLRDFGPAYRYLICGYPPFLKHLLDEGTKAGLDWRSYSMDALVGGEGMTEELRDHLLGTFDSVYSGYGATDLEIGMAAESPVSIALRRLARARPDVRQALFGRDSRLPMVFQYNPLIHFLEVNGEREIVATVSRLDLLAPRIRYNVHDEGGLIPFDVARRALAGLGLRIDDLDEAPEAFGPRGPLPWTRPVPMPFLFIYGRRDATISVMGANIYPEDLEAVIYGDADLASRVHSFQLSTTTDGDGTPRPLISLEIPAADEVDDAWGAAVAERLRQGLFALNIDYRAATTEFPEAMRPVVSIWGLGKGPFAGDAARIKQRRIAPVGPAR